MQNISFKRHRFPPTAIRHAICLYARFTLSYRDIEDLPAERGLDISCKTVRRWFQKFLNIQSATYNTFYVQRHLLNRTTFKQFRAEAIDVWKSASAAT